MSRFCKIGITLIILLNSCEEITSETDPISNHANYIGNSITPFEELDKSYTYSKLFSSEKHLFISYMLNLSEHNSFKELVVDLKHQFETDSYLDFGYSAKLNEYSLSRYHKSKNYNTFSYSQRTDDISNFWSIESNNGYIIFEADEGKMIRAVNQKVKNPEPIQITNIALLESIEIGSDFKIKLNRETTENNALIAIELETTDTVVDRFVFKQMKSTTEISFKQSDIEIMQTRISDLSVSSVRIWVLDERQLNSLISKHKLFGSVHYTPMILKSVFTVSAALN